jgi:hypothetical protein
MNGDMMIGDAMIDGDPSLDSDNDGVNDAIDNCRTAANADQHDEDRDMLGDVCDPCPPFATYLVGANMMDANVDSDNDGVGDGCDPDRALGGHRIVLFTGFLAQGAGSTMGPATVNVASDSATISAATQLNLWAALTFPVMIESTRSTSVRAGMRINTIMNGTVISPKGGAPLHYFDGGSRGTACIYGRSGPNPGFMLVETNANQPTTIIESPASGQAVLDVTIRHFPADMKYECVASSEPSISGMQSPTMIPSNMTRVGVYAREANVQFEWLLVIQGP